MADGKVKLGRLTPRGRAVFAATVVAVAVLWIWEWRTTLASDDMGWQAPVVSIVLLTGLVWTIVAWSVGRGRRREEAPPTLATLASVVLGTALCWAVLIFASDEEPLRWWWVALTAGLAAITLGTAKWGSARAMVAMLVTSWAFAFTVCVKVLVFDFPKNADAGCGSMDCIGQPDTPIEQIDFILFVFFPLLVVPATFQLCAWLVANPDRRKVTEPDETSTGKKPSR